MPIDEVVLEKEAVENLNKIAKEYLDNNEMAHRCADAIILKFLIESGHYDIVEAYSSLCSNIKFWYA